MLYGWVAAIAAFGILEGATAGLVSIWFVAGGIAALICCALGGALWLQIALFIGVSLLALVSMRPLARKLLKKDLTPTNADRVFEGEAKVTEQIDNENSSGAVYIEGKTWTARSEDGCVIPAGAMVTVTRMDGVKLFVREKKEEC